MTPEQRTNELINDIVEAGWIDRDDTRLTAIAVVINHAIRAAERETAERVRTLLANAARQWGHCACGPEWRDRQLHAPDCHWVGTQEFADSLIEDINLDALLYGRKDDGQQAPHP